MSEFSIKEAAFTGFRFTRENPVAIVLWAALSLASAFLYQWILINMAGEALGRMMEIQAAAEADPMSADPTAIFPLMGTIYSALAVSYIPLIVTGAVLTAAATRGVLNPESRALGFLRLGGAELRMIIVLIVIGVIIALIFMVGSIIASIVGVSMMIASSGGQPPSGAMTGQMLVGMAPILFLTALLCLFVYGRFSLAAPLTVDRRAINIFSSVTLTKGLGGRLFRTYLLSCALYLIVVLLGVAIFFGVAAAMTGDINEVVAFYMTPDMSSAAAFFTPLRIIYLVLMSIFSALGAAILLTPPVTVYRALTEDGVDEVF